MWLHFFCVLTVFTYNFGYFLMALDVIGVMIAWKRKATVCQQRENHAGECSMSCVWLGIIFGFVFYRSCGQEIRRAFGKLRGLLLIRNFEIEIYFLIETRSVLRSFRYRYAKCFANNPWKSRSFAEPVQLLAKSICLVTLEYRQQQLLMIVLTTIDITGNEESIFNSKEGDF